MGILNVTPDLFSDGGRFLDPSAAIAHARRMVAEGADIIDIGAESTRPYGTATPVSPREEARRLEPVLAAVAGLGVPVSIDTMKAQVAELALAAGARIVNDVWGLQRDPDMAGVVARHAVPVIVMHNRETADPAIDIMADIAAFFARSLALAERAGIARDRIVLDPGIGFGKTPEQSLDGAGAARPARDIRLAASGRGFAQTIHRQGLAGTARPPARRLARRASHRGRGRRPHHPRP